MKLCYFNKGILILSFVINLTRLYAQQQYCNGNLSSNPATITFHPDGNDCNFSLEAAPYYTATQSNLFPEICVLAHLPYEYYLFLNTGAGYQQVGFGVCTSSNPYTFKKLSQTGTYKVIIEYYVADYCQYIQQRVLDLYIDEGFSVVATNRNVCPLNAGGSTIHWYNNIDLNCTVPNNVSTVITSGTKIVAEPGSSMIGTTSNGFFSASIVDCSSLHRPVHLQNSTDSIQNNNSIDKLSSENLIVFPNPNNGLFTLKLNQTNSEFETISDEGTEHENFVYIYNSIGQLVYKTSTYLNILSINISG